MMTRTAMYASLQRASEFRRRRIPTKFAQQPDGKESKFKPLGFGPAVGFVVCSYQAIGGTETFHKSLIPRLRQRQNICGFVATDFHGGDGSVLRVPYDTGMLAAKELASHCDILVTWGISNLREVLNGNRPRIINVHHSDITSDWGNSVTLQQLDVIDMIVCVNEHVAQTFSERGKPTLYIPNAIDPERIRTSAEYDSLRLRNRFGIPESAKICLFGHRLSEEKRPQLACEIAAKLPDGWVMVIVGGGHERAAVEQLAAASGKIIYAGIAESLADWLGTADCFLSLSTFEGFGLAIGESMVAGVPTVSTPTGIAPGLAITRPVDSEVSTWVDAIVNSNSWRRPTDITERFSVERMVSAWSDLLSNEGKFV